jgi:hypothetical protein
MKTLLHLVLVLVVSAASHPGPAAENGAPTAGVKLTDEQQAWLQRAWRFEKNGWLFLHLAGAPQERGFQHGFLLAREIQESLRGERIAWKHHSGMEWSWLVARAKEFFVPAVDPENLAEIDGIVAGLAAAGVLSSREELVAYNGIIELAYYWWPQEKDRLKADRPPEPRKACSAFIATGSATADGRIVLGHNTMGGYATANCNVILDLAPERGQRLLMQGQPGWIHSGTDFFITGAGLVGAETTISGFTGFDTRGIPEFARMRRAAQDATTIDEWCAIMKRGNNGGYANAWLLGDIKTNEIARLELGLKYVAFERTRDGYYLGANVAEDISLLRLETDFRETDIRLSGVARRVRWKQLMRQHAGKIDLEAAKRFEADHYDVYLHREFAGERTLCAHSELVGEPLGRYVPFAPTGTIDAKVVDARLAHDMAFAARWGAACGRAFDAKLFLAARPQFDWMEGLLKSRPSQPWTVFRSGTKP